MAKTRKKKRPVSKKTPRVAKKKAPAKKKKAAAKSRKTAPKAKAKKPPKIEGKRLGVITHFFPHVNAGVLKIASGQLRRGDRILIKGHTTQIRQKADSMQMDHVSIQVAKKGDEIGIQVDSRVRAGDTVYRLS